MSRLGFLRLASYWNRFRAVCQHFGWAGPPLLCPVCMERHLWPSLKSIKLVYARWEGDDDFGGCDGHDLDWCLDIVSMLLKRRDGGELRTWGLMYDGREALEGIRINTANAYIEKKEQPGEEEEEEENDVDFGSGIRRRGRWRPPPNYLPSPAWLSLRRRNADPTGGEAGLGVWWKHTLLLPPFAHIYPAASNEEEEDAMTKPWDCIPPRPPPHSPSPVDS